MSKPASVRSLMDLGFTELEAEIYCSLVQESPATGYRVAQMTGRLPGNVYKALESLESKGAVIIEEGSSRMARAVPPRELLGMLRRRYEERESIASTVLSELRPAEDDERIYQLRSSEQFFERARAMLARAQHAVVADFPPEVIELLRPELEETALRTPLNVKVFEPTHIEGAEVVVNPRGAEVLARYPGRWVILIIDAAEVLVGSLTLDLKQIVHGLWTTNSAMCHVFHAALSAEFMTALLMNYIAEGIPAEDLRKGISPFVGEAHLSSPEEPFQEVIRRYMRLYSVQSMGLLPLWERYISLYGGEIPPSILGQRK